MNSPTVTVFIPCYNAERFIAEAIDSILNQTYQDFEVLIIDDGSTDNSRNIIECYSRKDNRIRVLLNDCNRGVGYTRNRGVKEARGKYFATLDADDIALPTRLEREVSYLNHHKSIGIVSGGMYVIDEKGKLRGKAKFSYNYREMRARLLFENPIVNSASIYRLEIVKKNDIRYKDNFHGIEDYMFWCELMKYTDAVVLNEYFVYYRIVRNGLTCTNVRKCDSERKRCIDKVHMTMLSSNGIVINKKLLNYCISKYSLTFFENEKIYNVKICIFLLQMLIQTVRKPYFNELRAYIIDKLKQKINNLFEFYI